MVAFGPTVPATGASALTVGICFFRDEDLPYRVLNVEIMVFDDSTLPKRSSMDMVLHPAFATPTKRHRSNIMSPPTRRDFRCCKNR